MVESSGGRESLLLIEEEMKDSYLSYAMSVIVSRALPDARDGLKPSQRRVLVTMNDLNLGPRSKFRKCAKIAGDTSGNYHPHGESVVYPTLVRMAQPFNIRYALVNGQGNFGSIDGDPPAAMRYTEARMTVHSFDMMTDLELDTVDFVPNYEDTRKEPVVLPSRFPNLLVNGSSGIAVGMATSIPPHNVSEVCAGLMALIDNPTMEVDEMMQYVKGPDFPTGGILCGVHGVREAYRTGRGMVTVRGKTAIEPFKKDRERIVITEIPYQVNKTTLIEKIAELVKDERVTGISDIRDESDKDGMRIVIELKKGEDSNVILTSLYRFSQLQENFSIINIALVEGRPRTLPLTEMMMVFIDHRRTVIRRRTQFLLAKAEARLHILEGYRIALDNIDEVIETIRASADVPEARAGLMSKFGLSELQADAILQMRLQRLTGLERDKIEEEYAKVSADIAYYKSLLAEPKLIDGLIKEDLESVQSSFGDDRRSEIGEPIDDIVIEDLIVDEEVAITMSHTGYIKRLGLDEFRSQRRGGLGVSGSSTKDDDFIERFFTAFTKDFVLFFTNRGRVHWKKVYQLPAMGRQSRGRAMANVIELEKDERITSVIPVRDFTDGDLFMVTQSGSVKRTNLSAFSRPKRGGIIAIGLAENDSLVGVQVVQEHDEVILVTSKGMSIRFPVSLVRVMGRPARGVRGIGLRDADHVVGSVRAEPDTTILTVCENGYGKRTAVPDYRLQGRGGFGVIDIRTTERNGNVVGVLAVREADDVILTTESGMVVRMAVHEISVIGRATQGVRLIRLKETDRVSSLAHVVKFEDDPEGEDPEGGDPAIGDPAIGDQAIGDQASGEGPPSEGDGTGDEAPTPQDSEGSSDGDEADSKEERPDAPPPESDG